MKKKTFAKTHGELVRTVFTVLTFLMQCAIFAVYIHVYHI